ncbi:MAG: twin-arginine translocation signal domain-containing protein, partial [Xanthobacteraceae bacterium]|nr:twin-arginine translocation signal domain-containing protein [Xanthobacteraceae bacterium]
MLIKRREQDPRRRPLAERFAEQPGGFDRRTFLRRSGLAAGGLAALGTLKLGAVRKAEAGPPPPAGAQVTVRKSMCT